MKLGSKWKYVYGISGVIGRYNFTWIVLFMLDYDPMFDNEVEKQPPILPFLKKIQKKERAKSFRQSRDLFSLYFPLYPMKSIKLRNKVKKRRKGSVVHSWEVDVLKYFSVTFSFNSPIDFFEISKILFKDF